MRDSVHKVAPSIILSMHASQQRTAKIEFVIELNITKELAKNDNRRHE